MKRVLLILCLFLFVCETGANSATLFPPLQPIGSTNPVQDYNNNITSAADPFATPNDFNLSALSRIEQSLFGHSFANLNVVSRLSKIEKSLFNATYPNASATQRMDNIISNFNQINKYPNISKNTLSKIEKKVFNQTFSQNSPDRRIERLEQQVFGAVQSGDIDSRYQNLIIASKNSNSNPDAIINRYASRPNLMGNMGMGGSMLGGSMTGFTPPIDPYSNYGSNNNYASNNNNGNNDPFTSFNPASSGGGIYRGDRNNNGMGGYSYHDSFTNYGTGAGVHIMD